MTNKVWLKSEMTGAEMLATSQSHITFSASSFAKTKKEKKNPDDAAIVCTCLHKALRMNALHCEMYCIPIHMLWYKVKCSRAVLGHEHYWKERDQRNHKSSPSHSWFLWAFALQVFIDLTGFCLQMSPCIQPPRGPSVTFSSWTSCPQSPTSKARS